MPSNWLTIDNNFPTFTGEETPEQQIRSLHNYLFQLREGLQYSLQNLTADNFNATALQNLSESQKNEVTKQLQQVYAMLNQMTGQIDSLIGRIAGTEDLGGRMNYAEADIDELQRHTQALEENDGYLEQRLGSAESDIAQLQEQISGAEADVDELQQLAQTLEESMKDLTEEGGALERLAGVERAQQEISGVIQTGEDGSTTIGKEGTPLYLVGEIYINGVLFEQGETT